MKGYLVGPMNNRLFQSGVLFSFFILFYIYYNMNVYFHCWEGEREICLGKVFFLIQGEIKYVLASAHGTRNDEYMYI